MSDTTPILFDTQGQPLGLERIPFGELPFNESKLQQLLADHPNLLPVGEIEEYFAHPVCIGREIICKAGKIDNLYLNASGAISLVETKLWKNPESRRKVVAQVLDYVKELAQWDYETLQSKASRYLARTHNWTGSLFDWIESSIEGSGKNEQQFIDQVSRSLRHGRFLVLIAGDGIREDAQELTQYLNDAAQFQFRLALVEMNCFRRIGETAPCLIVPQVVAKTVEIERAVVRIELSDEAENKVTVRTGIPKGDGKTTAGIEGYFESLETHLDYTTIEEIRRFAKAAEECSDLIELSGTSQLIIKSKYEIGGVPDQMWMVSFTPLGRVFVGGQHKWAAGEPLPREVIERFWARIGQLLPKLQPQIKSADKASKPTVPASEFLLHKDALIEALKDTMLEISELMAEE